jgi:hypothetical protein
MSDEQILGNFSMTQPKVTTSQDESGRVIYHCTIEVYNVRTGHTEMKFTGSNPDEVQACIQAASQGLEFMKNSPDDAYTTDSIDRDS